MTAPAPRQEPLIRGLAQLKQRENRGALAALRRGLGKPAGTAPEMFPYVEPYIPVNDYAGRVDAAYLLASLFGLHPYDSGRSGEVRTRQQRGLGASLAGIRRREGSTDEDEGVARRFGAALNCDREALPTHLRHLMSLFHSRSPDTAIDFMQLYDDISDWDAPDRRVQRAWAAGFWRRTVTTGDDAAATTEDTPTPTEEED